MTSRSRIVRPTARHRSACRVSLVVVALLAATLSGLAPTPAVGAPAGGRGDRIEYFFTPTGQSRPYGITPGPDGNLWFTESDSDMVARVTPRGEITEFFVGANKAPYGIATGPDGNLWFTEKDNNKIGKMSPQGVLLDEFPVPSGDTQPWDIAAGADGAMWFTEANTSEHTLNNIGRVDMDGVITEHELHPCACFPIGIAAGPDGNLWVTEEIGNTIDKVSTAPETLDRYDLPTTQSLPWDIQPGPDGAMWFTELANRHIGRVTMDGDIDEFPVPGFEFGGLAGIVTGSDGNLWFTENDNRLVRVMTPDGDILRSFPTHPLPIGITAGPDGNIWFTLAQAHEVGRLRVARPDTAYILSLAHGFAPARRTVRLGDTVQWSFYGPTVQRVVDNTGMGLYQSGPKRAVSYFSRRFTAAGTYPFRDPGRDRAGSLAVPVEVDPSTAAGAGVSVNWATEAPETGFVFDVQVRVGSGSWSIWKLGTTDTEAVYDPATSGSHAFRARLRRLSNGMSSGWSPPRTFEVG